MSVALVVALADAVTEQLNQADWSQQFTAVRSLLPEYDLENLDQLRVTVVPRAQQFQSLSRRAVRRQLQVDIAVQQRLDGPIEEVLPQRAALCDEFVRYFVGRRLAEPAAVCLGASNEPIYAVDHLRQMRVLTTVVTLQFQMSDALEGET